MNGFAVTPIGRVIRAGEPPRSSAKDGVSEIAIDEKYADGLDGIDGFSHIVVLFWLDRVEFAGELHGHARGRADMPEVGIFALRTPLRPNPIALTTVKLLERRGNVLTVEGLDALDGTPVIDLKPFSERYDCVKDAVLPDWMHRLQTKAPVLK